MLAAAAVCGLPLTACENGTADAAPESTGSPSGSVGGTAAPEAGGTPDGGGPTGAEEPSAGPEVCDNAVTSLKVIPVPRPVDHLLITLTNTGSVDCTVLGFPTVTFGPDLDGAAKTREDTLPQAVVTLAPGESAYAGLAASAADRADDGKPHASTVSVDLTASVDDGGSKQFGQPRGTGVGDLFVHEPTVTARQQGPDDALG